MQWFKNLNTMPKLMLSSGVLLAITAFIGYLGINKVGEIKQRNDLMYSRDLLGLREINELAIGVADAPRIYRDSIIYIKDPKMIASLEQELHTTLDNMHKHLDGFAKYATTPEAKAFSDKLREAYPGYEAIVLDVFDKAKAHDEKGAREALTGNKTIRKNFRQLTVTIGDFETDLAAKDKAQSEETYNSAVHSMTLLMAGAILSGLSLSFWIARMFAAPLIDSVNVLNRVAEGDLTQKLHVQSTDEIGRLAEALNTALSSMRTTLADVTEAADIMSSASQQLAMASSTMASGTHQQAASLEETSASLEQITSTVRQNADSAKQASQLALSSRASAEKGGAVVADAVNAMSEINSSSEKIADIIGTVDEIAFQTNLLAVNAAVEAARAGEQGRGFAVVASEVRSLAQRSAAAAKEIKTLIGDSVRKAKNGSDLVNHSGKTLQEIVASVKRVTDIVGEIASASQEQTLGIEQVNKAMMQMDQVTQNNATQTEDLSSTAESLSVQAQGLQQLVGRFVIHTAEEKAAASKAETVVARPVVAKQAAPRTNALVKRTQPLPVKASDSLMNLAGGVATAADAHALPISSSDFEEF